MSRAVRLPDESRFPLHDGRAHRARSVTDTSAAPEHRNVMAHLTSKPSSIERFLRYLGEPTEAPPLSAARDPPYFKTRAVRRALGELCSPRSAGSSQGELFEA